MFGDKIVQLCLKSMRFAGICINHNTSSIPKLFNTITDAIKLKKCLNNKIVHVADEIITVVMNSISHSFNDKLDIKILPPIASCGSYAGDFWVNFFCSVLVALNDKDFVALHGPTLTVGTDGCLEWIPPFKYIRTKYGIIPPNWDINVGPQMYGKSLYKLSAYARDLRHILKNLRGSCLSIKGIKIFGVHIPLNVFYSLFKAA
eukprot:334848_1